MKVVIAIDSFKGSLTSLEAGNSAAAGVRRVFLTRSVSSGLWPTVEREPWMPWLPPAREKR